MKVRNEICVNCRRMCYVDKIDIFLQTQMLRALALELRKLQKKKKNYFTTPNHKNQVLFGVVYVNNFTYAAT